MSAATPNPKVVATAQARAAMAGFALLPQPDGSFLVARWGHARALGSVADVHQFLERVASRLHPRGAR
jgi:hypothetical protein